MNFRDGFNVTMNKQAFLMMSIPINSGDVMRRAKVEQNYKDLGGDPMNPDAALMLEAASKRNQLIAPLLDSAIGGMLGAGIGSAVNPFGKTDVRNIALGSGIGALAGIGTGLLQNRYFNKKEKKRAEVATEAVNAYNALEKKPYMVNPLRSILERVY